MKKRPMFWTQGDLKEEVTRKLTKLGINQATLIKSQGQQQSVSLHLNEQEFGIIVEETNELLDMDNLQIEKLEKMKALSERQLRQENREDFKETIEINSVLNTKNPLMALADKSHLTQTSYEVNPDQEGVNNIGQKQLQLRWELIDELKQQV